MPFSQEDLIRGFGDKLFGLLTMTQADLEAIQARVEAATPGPWEGRPRLLHNGREISCEIVGNIHPGWATPVCQLSPGFAWYENDKDFLTSARTDIPALLAEIEALRRACYHYATQMGRWGEKGKKK
jgi:hypothetical protein